MRRCSSALDVCLLSSMIGERRGKLIDKEERGLGNGCKNPAGGFKGRDRKTCSDLVNPSHISGRKSILKWLFKRPRDGRTKGREKYMLPCFEGESEKRKIRGSVSFSFFLTHLSQIVFFSFPSPHV